MVDRSDVRRLLRHELLVIVVHDFEPHIGNDEIENISRQLRKACGCGGTVKDRAIELQGDQPAKIRSALEAAGFRVDGIR